MCGRYVLESLVDLPEDLSERFDIRQIPLNLMSTFNAAPSQLLPVIVESEEGERIVRLMNWGLTPRWASRGKPLPPPINARLETIDQKPMFKGLLPKQRCLVPNSGFFEWKATSGGKKQPYFIHVKDEPLSAFAGLWDETKAESASPESSGSFTIVTREAVGPMTELHHRMPVILARALEEDWLDAELNQPEMVTSLLRSSPVRDLEAYPVSTAVNNVRNNSPELIEPIEAEPDEEQGALF
jgi:putative SOS response-associated peptidase YedK